MLNPEKQVLKRETMLSLSTLEEYQSITEELTFPKGAFEDG